MAKRKDPTLSAPEERAILDWGKKATVDVLACRQFGHAWGHGLTTIYKIGGFYVRNLGCTRCGTQRRDATPVGEYGAVRRSYIYPNGYGRERSDEGSTRIPRWAIADAMLDRSKNLEPPNDLVDWFHKRGRE
jgi:hypothetical protein